MKFLLFFYYEPTGVFIQRLEYHMLSVSGLQEEEKRGVCVSICLCVWEERRGPFDQEIRTPERHAIKRQKEQRWKGMVVCK